MRIDQKLKNSIRTLLSQIPEIAPIKLEPRAIDAWINNLERAYKEPEDLPQAWFPILLFINTDYWDPELDSTTFHLIDKRNELTDVIVACEEALNKVTLEPHRKIFAEQICVLTLTYAKIFHLYHNGNPLLYSTFGDFMNRSEKFIKENRLSNTKSNALWHYLKACGALKSSEITNKKIAAFNERIGKQNTSFEHDGDKKKLQHYLKIAIEHSSEAVRIHEEVLGATIEGVLNIEYRYALVSHAKVLMYQAKHLQPLSDSESEEICKNAWDILSRFPNYTMPFAYASKEAALIREVQNIKKELQQICPTLAPNTFTAMFKRFIYDTTTEEKIKYSIAAFGTSVAVGGMLYSRNTHKM